MSVQYKDENGILQKGAGLYKSEVPIGIADIYTESERQVGLWTDGKPLYQKSIKLDDVTVPQSGRVLIGLGTYISNIDNVIGGEVIVIDGSTNLVLPSFQIATMSQYGLTYTINKADGIVISRGSDSGAVTRDFIATVRYTKTTDSSTGVLPKSASALYLMGDVEISNPQNGEVLKFDDEDNKWKNGTGGGGGNANIWTGTQAELEEVFDELEEGTQINITDDEQEVVEGGTIYSEEEQVIGLWTDNRPLYQKTISFNALTSGANNKINNEITITNYKIVEFSGTVFLADGVNELAIPYVTSNQQLSAFFSDGVYVFVSSNLSVSSGYLTITYTKNADSPLDVVVGKRTMYIASSDCYSTEEKEVGCFTDGKPMYQKTLYFDGTIPRNTWTAHNISDVDKIWVFDAFGKRSTDYRYNGINYVSDTDYTAVFVNKTQVYISYATDNTMTNGYITVRYTKTTDTAGSGQYTPASGKAVHYSTDEQVIGTWIDGKPLYRKVITGLSLQTAWQGTYYPNVSTTALISDTKDIINARAIMNYDNGVSRSHICSIVTNSSNNTWALITSDDITINTLVLEYTKTTD